MACIRTELVFEGATLTNPDGDTLAADGLAVEGGMFCHDGFNATDAVRLPATASAVNSTSSAPL